MNPSVLTGLVLLVLRASAGSAGNWIELPGKDCYPEAVDLTKKNIQLADCFHVAVSQGYQVFTFDGANAYFRRTTASDCQDHAKYASSNTLLFVMQTSPSTEPPTSSESNTLWVDPGWLKLPGKDCYSSQVDLTMSSDDMKKVFEAAAGKGYQVFSVVNGNAYLRDRTSEDCKSHQFDMPQNTLFVYKQASSIDSTTILPSTTSLAPVPTTEPPVTTTTPAPTTPALTSTEPPVTTVTPAPTAPPVPTTPAVITPDLEPTASTEPASLMDAINQATVNSAGKSLSAFTDSLTASLNTPAPAIADANPNAVQTQYDATAKKQYSPLGPSLAFLSAGLGLFALGAWAWRNARGRRGGMLQEDPESGSELLE